MTAIPQPKAITETERARRQKAVDTARASVRLEGFTLDAETEALNARYVNGELTSDELTQEILKLSGLR